MSTPEHLAWNPQLPEAYQGAWQDAQYNADVAGLRSNIIRNYQGVLQQLGYTDDQGNYIPGALETENTRQQGALDTAIAQAAQAVTNQMQQRGTLFSGRRGDIQAQAESPFRTQQGQLTEALALNQGNLMTQARDLLSNYGRDLTSKMLAAIGRYQPPAIATPNPAAAITSPGAVAPTTSAMNTPIPSTYRIATGPAAKAGSIGEFADQAQLFPGSPTYAINAGLTPAQVAANAGRFDPETGLPSSKSFVYPNDPDYRNARPATMGTPVRRAAYAEGGIVDEPTNATIGEAGPEAVVPLEDGLQGAIQRLLMMYMAQGGGAVGGEPPPQQGPPQGQPTGQVRPPNVAAKGLKAAASIMSELAKHHEADGGMSAGPSFQAPAFQGGPAQMNAPRGALPPRRGPGPIQAGLGNLVGRR